MQVIRSAVQTHPADKCKVSTHAEPMVTVTQPQKERLIRVVGVIKLPFSVRMLMISPVPLLMGKHIYRKTSESV